MPAPLIPLLGEGPVDPLKPAFHIFGPAVLVVQIVGMLPHVQTEHRPQSRGQGAVLVGQLHNGQLRKIPPKRPTNSIGSPKVVRKIVVATNIPPGIPGLPKVINTPVNTAINI